MRPAYLKIVSFNKSTRYPVIIPKFPRYLINKIIKSSLSQRVCRFALPFRKRICPRQPIENKLTKRLERKAHIPLDFTLPNIKGIQACQNSVLQLRFDLRIKVLSKRLLDDC